MTYTSVLTPINDILDTVTGIGTTHDTFRHIVDITDQKSAFTSSGVLHAWFITRSSVESQRLPNKQVKRNHTFDLWGFYAVNDSETSELTFQAVIDSVLTQFDNIDRIELLNSVLLLETSKLNELTHAIWCDVLCHRAHIQLIADEDKSVAEEVAIPV